MEEKKSYPPLPSNYVTLAELQQRWLQQKEKEKEKELQQKQEEQQRLQQEQSPKPCQQNPCRHQQRQSKSHQEWRAIQSRGTDSATGNLRLKKFGPPNGDSSERNRVAIEVSCEKSESLEAKADIGDKNAGQDGKKKESKKKKKRMHRKPKAAKEEKKLADDAAQSTMEGAKEAENSNVQMVDDKTEIKTESKTEIKTESKTETKTESDGSKSNKSMTEIAEKLGTLSMNSGSDKQNQNDRLGRPFSSFRGSSRNYGSRSYGNGPYGGRFRGQEVQRQRGDNWRNYGGRRNSNGPYGGRFRGQEVQRQRNDKKTWVRKNEDSDGNVGGIQIASGK